MTKCCSLVLFLAVAALAPAAHADTIDDFVLTGNGLTISFSLPASPLGNASTCPPGSFSCLPGSQTAFYLTTLVTTNGVAFEESLAFPTDRFGGGLEIDALHYDGPQLFEPDAANPTFLTDGPFTLDTLNFSEGPPILDYSLTITPETPSSITPEPSTAILFATGILGLFARTNVSRRRA